MDLESPQVGQWYPAETAPRDGSFFVVHTSCGYELAHYYTLSHEVYVPVEYGLYRKEIEQYADGFNVNHFEWWTPLPAAPSLSA